MSQRPPNPFQGLRKPASKELVLKSPIVPIVSQLAVKHVPAVKRVPTRAVLEEGTEVEFLGSAPTETNAVLLKNATPPVDGTTIVIYRSEMVSKPFVLWQIDPPVPNGGSPRLETTVWYDLFRVPTDVLANDRAAVAQAILRLLDEMGQQNKPGDLKP